MNASRAWFEKDFYAVLGLAESASAEEIKRAYKKIARENHPDRNPGNKAAEERMKDASEAYDVLSDQKKRQEYDQMRRLARSGYVGGAPGAGWESTMHFEDIPFDLGEVFGGMFGGGRARRGPRRGADLETVVRVPFEDAVHGTTVAIRGEGGEFKVKIPAGIADGERIRARGKGGAGQAGAGDLYVRVEVEPHPTFARKGNDLTVTVPITFPDAALGAHVAVPTLDGSVTLNIPPGTPSGKTFRVRGRGIARGQSEGDLLVTVQVEVPKKLSMEEREIIEQLAALGQNGSRAERKARR